MDAASTTTAELDATSVSSDELTTDAAVVEDVLVEEVSIDGMCGVY